MLRHVRAASAFAVLLAFSLIIAACGSDENGSGSTKQGDSEKEALTAFVDDANELCTDSAREYVDEFADVDPPESADEARAWFEEQREFARGELDRYEELEAPEQAAVTWDDISDRISTRIDTLDKAIESVDDGPEATREVFDSAPELDDDLREDAVDLGLDPCVAALSEERQEEAAELAELAITGEDPERFCNDVLTERFAKALFNSVSECEERQAKDIGARVVAVHEVSGVEGVEAHAEVVFVGGIAGTTPDLGTWYLIEDEDGTYRIHDLSIEKDADLEKLDVELPEWVQAQSTLDAYDAGLEPVNDAISELNERRTTVKNAQAAASSLRNELYEFDAMLRELEVPGEARDELNALLGSIGDAIRELDVVGEATNAAQTQEALDNVIDTSGELSDDSTAFTDALEELAEEE